MRSKPQRALRRFDPDCRACHRIAAHLDEVKTEFPDYHAAPVAPFGDEKASFLIVGLAPGMHGANATGRPFTGDFAGILLYKTLFLNGFSNQSVAQSRDDGLELANCRITNAVKCLPPKNKPLGVEIDACNGFLSAELQQFPAGGLVLALGTVAHNAVLKACGLKLKDYPFSHSSLHKLPDGMRLLDSYHCSRYNTQTGRLSAEMFEAVFQRARVLIG